MTQEPENVSLEKPDETRMKDTNAQEKQDGVQTLKEADTLTSSPNRQKVLRALLLQRWAALGGILSLGVLYLFISPRLTFAFFPRWLPLVLEGILVLPFVYSLVLRRRLPVHLTRLLSLLLAGVAMFALIASITLLLITLPHRGSSGSLTLVRDAALLWVSNILVFGFWYWELDGGGSLKRH